MTVYAQFTRTAHSFPIACEITSASWWGCTTANAVVFTAFHPRINRPVAQARVPLIGEEMSRSKRDVGYVIYVAEGERGEGFKDMMRTRANK